MSYFKRLWHFYQEKNLRLPKGARHHLQVKWARCIADKSSLTAMLPNKKGGPEAAFGVYPLDRLEVVAGPEQEAELMRIQTDIVGDATVHKPIGGRGPTVPEGRIQGDVL